MENKAVCPHCQEPIRKSGPAAKAPSKCAKCGGMLKRNLKSDPLSETQVALRPVASRRLTSRRRVRHDRTLPDFGQRPKVHSQMDAVDFKEPSFIKIGFMLIVAIFVLGGAAFAAFPDAIWTKLGVADEQSPDYVADAAKYYKSIKDAAVNGASPQANPQDQRPNVVRPNPQPMPPRPPVAVDRRPAPDSEVEMRPAEPKPGDIVKGEDGWLHADFETFSVVSDGDENLVKLFSTHANFAYANLPEMMGCNPDLTSRRIIKLYASADEYATYSNNSPASASYGKFTDELFVNYRSQTTLKTFYREAVRMFLDMSVPNYDAVTLPGWFEEGMASYVASGEFPENGEPTLGMVNRPLLERTKAMIAENSFVPVREFLFLPSAAFFDETDPVRTNILRAQAWSFMHFLKTSGHPAISALMSALESGSTPDEAMLSAFNGIDFDILETAWKTHVSMIE